MSRSSLDSGGGEFCRITVHDARDHRDLRTPAQRDLDIHTHLLHALLLWSVDRFEIFNNGGATC